MRSLLDTNVLIAVLDEDHASHDVAFAWFHANHENGWSGCPLIENGCLRILSNPNYSKIRKFPLSQLIAKFAEIVEKTDHEFWSDNISLLDTSLFDTSRIIGPRQLTDIYLLALAVHHNGRLVTFDERIDMTTVKNAGAENLCVI